MPEQTAENPPAGTTSATNNAPASSGSEQTSRRARARQFIRSMGGDADRAVALLQKDLEAANRKLASVGDGNPLPAGAVVLTADEAKAWAAYTALGKADEVKARIEKATGDAEFRAKVEREMGITKVAEAVGYKPKPLIRLARDLPAGARLEAREIEVEEDGEQVKRQVAHVVTGTGDAANAEPLDKYGPREIDDWADVFLPALRGDAEGADGDAAADRSSHGRASVRGASSSATGTEVVRYPDQRESGAPRKADPVKSYTASVRGNGALWGAPATAGKS